MADRNYLGFVWDENKNQKNRKKHGIDFETAVFIFNDPLLYIQYDEIHSDEEERNLYIGQIADKYIVTMVATDKLGITRVISARKATSKEVKIYEKNAKAIRGY